MLSPTKHKPAKNRSFQEKSKLFSIMIILLVYGFYFVNLMAQRDLSQARAFTTLAIVTFVFIAVQTAAQSILAALFANEAAAKTTPSERSANLQAHKLAYRVFIAGVLVSLVLTLLELGGFWLFQIILLTLVVAELSRFIAELVILRRLPSDQS